MKLLLFILALLLLYPCAIFAAEVVSRVPSVKKPYTVTCPDCGSSFTAKPKSVSCCGARVLAGSMLEREYSMQFKCSACKGLVIVNKPIRCFTATAAPSPEPVSTNTLPKRLKLVSPKAKP